MRMSVILSSEFASSVGLKYFKHHYGVPSDHDHANWDLCMTEVLNGFVQNDV